MCVNICVDMTAITRKCKCVYIYIYITYLLEKGMAIHPSILAWRIPWMEKPGGLQSVGSQRVGHDWATNTHTHTHMHTHTKHTYKVHRYNLLMCRYVWWSYGKEHACQCRRHKGCSFDPWVGKDPLEEGMASHSSILAWRIPQTEEPAGL